MNPLSGKSGEIMKKLSYGFVFFVLIILSYSSTLFASACNPVSAQLCAAADDYAVVYLNGTFIDTFSYCDKGNPSCTPKCESLTTAQLALLTDTGNYICVEDQNTATDEFWASWSLDITCSGVGAPQVQISSDNRPVSLYYNPTCVNPAPAPALNGGYNWYDPLYNQGTSGLSWVPPVPMSGQKWGKRISDPSTGNLLGALCYTASYASTACGALFFREGFALTPNPTPVPPNFTITKSANPSTLIGQTPPSTVTFTLHICNTGGGTQGNPVVINDTWTNSTDNWSYYLPGTYTDLVFGEIDYSGSNPNATITFANGFNANTCYDYVFSVVMYSGQPTFCLNWSNAAILNYLSVPVATASVGLSDYCPPPPSFTLTKSTSTSTVNGPNQNITFTMHLCNTGGVAWSGTMTLFDDMSSAPGGSGSWQYTGPYYVGAPATGINNYSTSGSDNVHRTYTIAFQQPGFTGCIDIPYYCNSSCCNYGCGPWQNIVSMAYFASPTVVASVAMMNICSPSFTPTFTRTPTPTYTVTNTTSPTFTKTNTVTATPTVTQTMPPMVIALTKTEDKTIVLLGDNVQYCLNYINNGTSPATFNVWDTIPAPMDFVSCTGGCTQAGTLLEWTITNLGVGNSGSVCFIVKVNRLPFLMEFKDYLAWIFDRKKYLSDCGGMPLKE